MRITLSGAARRGAHLLAGAALFALAACGGAPPPPPPPTIAAVTVNADKNLNPGADGQAAPVMLRIYQLASPAAFQKAEFFSLLNKDQATLGPDMIKRDEYLLLPASTKEQSLTLPDTVQAVGLFAAYRDFQHASWRLVLTAPPHKTTTFTIRAGADGITLAAP